MNEPTRETHRSARGVCSTPEPTLSTTTSDRATRTGTRPRTPRLRPRSRKTAVALTAAAAGIAASLAAPLPADAASGKPAVPFFAVRAGRGPVDLTTGAFTTSGVFVAMHLGLGALSVNASPGEPFAGVFRGADGDEVHVRDDPSNLGSTLPTNCPTNVGIASGPYAGGKFIVGGTGKYAGATGYITYSGCFAYVPDASSPTGFTFHYTFVDHGTLVR